MRCNNISIFTEICRRVGPGISPADETLENALTKTVNDRRPLPMNHTMEWGRMTGYQVAMDIQRTAIN